MAKSVKQKESKEPIKAPQTEYVEANAEEIGHVDPSKVIQLSNTTTDVRIVNPQEQAKAEVAKFDITVPWIEERKAKYAGLKVEGLEDKEGLKKVTEAWQEIKGKRFEVRDRHKELKEGYLVVGRAIDAAKNQFTGLLEEIETPLKAEIDRIETLKEEAKLQKQRQEQEKLQSRIMELLDNGIKLVGNFYCIGETLSVDVVTIKQFDDENYAAFLGRVKKEHQVIKDQEEADKAAEEKRRKDQEKLEADNKRLADELREEQDRIKKERADSRGEVIENYGYVKDGSNYRYQLDKDLYSVISVDSLGEMSKEEWEVKKAEAKQAVADIEKEAARRHAFEARKNTLSDLGVFTLENRVVYAVAHDAGNILICTLEELNTISDEEFTELTQTTRKIIAEEKEKYNMKQAEETDRKASAAVHANDMIHLGFILIGNTYKRVSKYDPSRVWEISKEHVEQSTVEDWGNVLEDAKIFVEQLEEYDALKEKEEDKKKEDERRSALSDVERVREFLKELTGVMANIPVVDSILIQSSLNDLVTHVENEVTAVNYAINKIEKAN